MYENLYDHVDFFPQPSAPCSSDPAPLLPSSEWRCFKCRTVIAASAGIPCMLMTATVSVFPAWGNSMRNLRSLTRNAPIVRAWVLPLCAHGQFFFFRKRLRPLCPSVSFLLWSCEEKQLCRGLQRLDASELMSAQVLCTSLSPHRNVSPVLFSQPDKRPPAIASYLVSFGVEWWQCHWQPIAVPTTCEP